MLDLLPFPGAGCRTLRRGRGSSYSSHVSLPLTPATLVPGCTTCQCWVRDAMVPQFPSPCSCRNRPGKTEQGKQILPFWGEGLAVRINTIFMGGTGQRAEQ